MGAAITALKNTPTLRWVNPLELKNAVESALTARFGAKEAAKPKGKVNFLVTSRAWGIVHSVYSSIYAHRSPKKARRRQRLLRLRHRLRLIRELSSKRASSASYTSLARTHSSGLRYATRISRQLVDSCTLASRPSRMATCTSGTPRLSSSILATLRTMVGNVIYGTMTRTPRQRRLYTLRVYWR